MRPMERACSRRINFEDSRAESSQKLRWASLTKSEPGIRLALHQPLEDFSYEQW